MNDVYIACLIIWALVAIFIYTRLLARNRNTAPIPQAPVYEAPASPPVPSEEQARRPFYRPSSRPARVTEHDAQIAAITSAKITLSKTPILQPREYRVYKIAERILTRLERGECHVWAQVCLGELIAIESSDEAKQKEAFSSINSKRSDIVITDKRGYALAFLEYHGNRHYQQNAEKRDAVKRMAAQRAGIKFIEVIGEWEDAEIEHTIEQGLKEAFALAAN